MMPLLPSVTPERPFYTNDNTHVPLPHWKQPENFNTNRSHLSELPPLEAIGEVAASKNTDTNQSHLSELPPLEVIGEIAASLFTTTSTLSPFNQDFETTTIELRTQPILSRNITESHQKPILKSTRVVNLSKSRQTTEPTTTTTHKIVEQIEVDEMPTTNEMPATDELPTPSQFIESDQNTDQQPSESTLDPITIPTPILDNSNTTEDLIELPPSETPESSSFIDNSAEIRVSKEGNQIKLEWDQPEKTTCDNYLVNTTLLESKKSLSTASGNPYSYIKFYNGERIAVFIEFTIGF